MVGATPQTFATPAAPRMIGAPQPTAPAQPATGGLIAPQPAAQPVDTYDPSKSPMIGAAPHDYAADYAAVQDPARLSPDAGKPSMLRKIGGIATGALIGALNPKAGAEIGGAIVGGPRSEFERQYNADEAAAVQKRAEIKNEAGLADTQAQAAERANAPAIAAQKEVDAQKHQQDVLQQQADLETQREIARDKELRTSEDAAAQRTDKTLAASEQRTHEEIAAGERRTQEEIAASGKRAGSKDTPFDRSNAEAASKDVTTARGGDFRYRSMAGSLPKAKAGDQQAS